MGAFRRGPLAVQLLIGHDIAVAAWVADRIGLGPMTPPYTAIGFLGRDERLAAGFVFYGNVPRGNVDMAVAVNGFMTRGAIRAIAHYAFEQLQASRVTCRPPVTHERAIKNLKRAGFRPEAVLKDWHGVGGDALQMRIRKTEAGAGGKDVLRRIGERKAKKVMP